MGNTPVIYFNLLPKEIRLLILDKLDIDDVKNYKEYTSDIIDIDYIILVKKRNIFRHINDMIKYYPIILHIFTWENMYKYIKFKEYILTCPDNTIFWPNYSFAIVMVMEHYHPSVNFDMPDDYQIFYLKLKSIIDEIKVLGQNLHNLFFLLEVKQLRPKFYDEMIRPYSNFNLCLSAGDSLRKFVMDRLKFRKFGLKFGPK